MRANFGERGIAHPVGELAPSRPRGFRSPNDNLKETRCRAEFRHALDRPHITRCSSRSLLGPLRVAVAVGF